MMELKNLIFYQQLDQDGKILENIKLEHYKFSTMHFYIVFLFIFIMNYFFEVITQGGQLLLSLHDVNIPFLIKVLSF